MKNHLTVPHALQYDVLAFLSAPGILQQIRDQPAVAPLEDYRAGGPNPRRSATFLGSGRDAKAETSCGPLEDHRAGGLNAERSVACPGSRQKV